MKKKCSYFLLTLFFIGVISTIIPLGYPSDNEIMLVDTSKSDVILKDDPMRVSASVVQHDPRGYLTGRFFNASFADTSGGPLYDQLTFEIEVNVTQVSGSGYVVFASIRDHSLSFYNENGDYEDGFSLTRSSGIINSIGVHNATVMFNCTEMRALKLAGPYYVMRVDLFDLSGFPSDVDTIDAHDHYKPLYVINNPNVGVQAFDEPDDTYDLTFHNAVLVNDVLEVNFTFQSFGHSYSSDELYYSYLTLRNATGTTIVHYQQTMDLQSNTVYDITLKIPSEYLSAFKNHGGFAGNDFPTLLFQEIAVVQMYGDYSPFDNYNMSYTTEAYPVYNVNVSKAVPTIVLDSGITYDFGTMADNDTVDFILYSDNPDDILKMLINRTFISGPHPREFEISVVNGWGRHREIYYGGSEFVVWSDWWGTSGTETESTHIYTYMGKYSCPWRFFIHYPEDGGSSLTQELIVNLEIFSDSTPPNIILNSPTMGDNFNQYYGIPFTGITNDNSIIVRYDIICNNTVVKSFDMAYMNGPIGNSFSFVWFPPQGLTGNNIDVTLKAIDLGTNTGNETVTININPGTIPTPMNTIDKGLEWLRNHQNTDGSWDYYGGPSAGMTALAALCFIQAGLPYDQVVIDAINFLRNSFEDDPDPSVPGKVIRQSGHMTYESAMAIISLIAYNATLQTYDSSLDLLIDEGIDWLVATQNDETWGVIPSEAWYGGWRYGHDHSSSDLSVSQWVFLALSSYGYNDVTLWNKVDTFVRRCRGGHWNSSNLFTPDGGFTYTPSTVDWRDWGGSSYGSMTAAGIWGLYLSGSSPNDPDIVSALDWINNSDRIVGENPQMGNQFEYYWYLSASKAFLMAGRPEDQWWYDEITNYLNTHMIEESSTSAYWDNSMGEESPVFATVQAVLSQQVYHGEIPIQTLEVSLEAADGSGIYLWNSTIRAGYNYTTGIDETPSGISYSGLLPDKQTISIISPTKGDYFIDIFPTAGGSGITSPQNLILRGRALTASGHTIRYQNEIINYPHTHDYPLVLRYQMVLSTISGLDIFFLFDGYETFNNNITIDNVIYPTYVELNEQFDVSISMTNAGLGPIPIYSFFAKSDDFAVQTASIGVWNQGDQQTYTFHHDSTGLPAGIRTIVIGVIGDNTTPSLVRVKVQVGNRIPIGSLFSIDDVLSGTETITWNVTDPDGDPLTFTVILVEPDGSEVTLSSGITTYSYSFDTTDYPDNTNYKIALIANDGIDTVRFESSFFEILNDDTEDTETEDTETDTPNVTGPGFELMISLMVLSLVSVLLRRKK